VQKDTDDLTVFLHFWDLCTQMLSVNMLVKSTPEVKFIIALQTPSMASDPQSAKKDTDELIKHLRFVDLCMKKLFVKRW
jgi:hypothetical protein